jgi:hypothetical protein
MPSSVKSSSANNLPDVGSGESLISKKRVIVCFTRSLTRTGAEGQMSAMVLVRGSEMDVKEVGGGWKCWKAQWMED